MLKCPNEINTICPLRLLPASGMSGRGLLFSRAGRRKYSVISVKLKIAYIILNSDNNIIFFQYFHSIFLHIYLHTINHVTKHFDLLLNILLSKGLSKHHKGDTVSQTVI